MKGVFKIQSVNFLLGTILMLIGFFTASAQSTSSEYPTPVTTSEISGTIRARDVGDARLTSYYYVFNGTQGDVFVNVTANNLNGDIDIFAAEGLRPLSKISLYADSSPTETGRIVYLRQPLKLILRVEGRTPDDNPATFSIKFAGSFAAIDANSVSPEVEQPKVESNENGAIKVNSVGTIIDSKPEKTETEKETVAENPAPKPKKTVANTKIRPPKVVITDNTISSVSEKTTSEIAAEKEKTPAKTKESITRPKRTPRPKAVKPTPPESTAETKTPPPNPLENVRLIVLMKDGNKVEYPMTDVFRFSLNNNVLTIILKDGKIERRSILDIQKFSVE